VSRESEVEGHLQAPAGSPRTGTAGTPRIGRRLRSARRRLGVELAEVERVLRIRAKYLEALEEERFDALPGRAYARAFLREYAAYLRLDGETLVRALEARLPEPDEAEPAEPTDVVDMPASAWIYADRVVRHLPPRVDVLAALVAVALLALLLWHAAREAPPPPVLGLTTGAAPAPAPETRPRAAAVRKVVHRAARAPTVARLVLAPTGGDVWLLVRSGSEAGPVLYEGTVRPGGSLTFVRRQLWIRIGAPWNLVARVNGHVVGPLPTRPGNVIVTPAGVRSA
jgi:cytoskeleton protein RodZ